MKNTNSNESENLCRRLFSYNTEDQVTKLLNEYSYLSNPKDWQDLGHSKSNWSIAGNQQSSPVAAMAEKLVNSVDAVLIDACLTRNIDPRSTTAPGSMTEAVERFFEVPEGHLENLNGRERAKLAEMIQLVAAGEKGKNPCYSIIDTGEGQIPSRIPETILSLPGKDQTYKSDIKFVQGLFNMGGTGALRFCGHSGYQLVISRRNPDLVSYGSPVEDKSWGFTIVRRRNPTQSKESSVYEYLAPNRKLLSFQSDSLGNVFGSLGEKVKPIKYGTCIKLYEYSIGGLKTSAILDLNYELSRHFHQMALPIRVIEARERYRANTNVATLAGMSVRLSEDRSGILEDGFPADGLIDVQGIGKIPIKLYAFSSLAKNNLSHWVGNKAVIFTINGQMHAHLTKAFFTRREVNLNYIRDYIMLVLDCTEIDGRAREDLFMASRDRLSDGELQQKLLKAFAEWLGEHPGLRQLEQKRREEALKQNLADNKPFKDVLGRLIRTSPSLTNLFFPGLEVIKDSGFKWTKNTQPYIGKPFPTFFRLKDGVKKLSIECPIKSSCTVRFETDADNDYFKRSRNSGKFNATPMDMIKSFALWNGIGTMKIIVDENKEVGEVINIVTEVKDKTRSDDAFVSKIELKVVKPKLPQEIIRDPDPITEGTPATPRPLTPGGRAKKDTENGTDGSKGILIPEVKWVRKGTENWDRFSFNENTGLKILPFGDNLDIYLNEDNIYLRNEIMYRKSDPNILREQFKIGLVLGCLGIYHHLKTRKQNNITEDILEIINEISIGLAQVILSVISVSNLSRLDDITIPN